MAAVSDACHGNSPRTSEREPKRERRFDFRGGTHPTRPLWRSIQPWWRAASCKTVGMGDVSRRAGLRNLRDPTPNLL
jgi:hypothetical protein